LVKNPQAVSWIDQIPLEKWTQAYDGGKRYEHMTTNLAESTNSFFRGARSLPICALVKTIFERTNAWFVERATKMLSGFLTKLARLQYDRTEVVPN